MARKLSKDEQSERRVALKGSIIVHGATLRQALKAAPKFGVGDVVVPRDTGKRIRVTEKLKVIKNGFPGFMGKELEEPFDDVWGYDHIVKVVSREGSRRRTSRKRTSRKRTSRKRTSRKRK
jgi:hypothetical protein